MKTDLELKPVFLYTFVLCLEGLIVGFAHPLIALNLEYDHHSDTAIGVMVATPAIGILAAAIFAPALLTRFRAHQAVGLALLVSALTCVLLVYLNSYLSWLVLRFTRGFCCGFVFLMGEYCLNTYVPDRLRGRVISAYATVFAVCLILGPFILTLFDVLSPQPFYFLGTLLALGALAHWLFASEIIYRSEATGKMSILGFFRLMPMIAVGIIFGSFYETNFLSFMPLYAIDHGYEQETALLFISAIFLGDASMQYPIGWLADRYNRKKLQVMLALGVLSITIPLPLIFAYPWLVWPSLVLLGGFAGGIYTISLVRMGAAFQGRMLIKALSNAGIIWGVGGIVGPSLVGVTTDVLGKNGLIYCMIAVALSLLILACFDRSA